jgi:endonuclease III
MFLAFFMQFVFQFGQREDMNSIQHRLAVYFGKIRVEKRPDPVSQFVGSILGSRTYDAVSLAAFQRLVKYFQNWDALADAPESNIHDLIKDVTFPKKKVIVLKTALQNIREYAGGINIDFLADLDVNKALCWLERIRGVGRKTSAATLNFSALHGRAFVLDTHVLRVLRRFGFIGEYATTEQAYDFAMVAADDLKADDLFELHWFLKRLGQQTCRQVHAACSSCPLSDICMKRRDGELSAVSDTFIRVA